MYSALCYQASQCSTPRLAPFCAGPIRTKIWDDLIRNAEPIADSGSLFAEHVQVAHALSVTEASKRSWFWEPEVIGKQVWKVSPQADLHATAVGRSALVERRKGLLHVMKEGPTARTLTLLHSQCHIMGVNEDSGKLWKCLNIYAITAQDILTIAERVLSLKGYSGTQSQAHWQNPGCQCLSARYLTGDFPQLMW